MPKKKITIEDLAVITKHGFDAVDKRFEGVDKRFEQVDKRLDQMQTSLGHLETITFSMRYDIAEIKKHFVYRYEFEDALGRIANIEKKLGIKIGK